MRGGRAAGLEAARRFGRAPSGQSAAVIAADAIDLAGRRSEPQSIRTHDHRHENRFRQSTPCQ